MSVINSVLKNLESKQSKFTPIEINTVAADAASVRDLKPLLLIAALLLALAAVAWIYRDHLPGMVSVPVPVAASVVTEVPLPVAQAIDEAAIGSAAVTDQMIGNQIIGLQIRESEEDMRMEFALREKVVAYLKERGEASFGYHLRDIESQIVAPHMRDNPWIEELSIMPSATGVDIYFETADDILVETRQELRHGESIWSINLRKSAAPTGSENTSLSVVAPLSEPVVSESQPVVAAVVKPAPTKAPETIPVEESAGPVEIDIKSTNPNVASVNQLEYAVSLINSGRTAKAETLLQGLLGGVEDYSARQHLLALYERQKQANRARRLLRESMTKYPETALFTTEYARLLFKAAAYRAVIDLLGNDAATDSSQQALVAASYQRLDEHESAVRHYRLALAQDAGNARNWIGMGISQEHTAALEDALKSYQRAAQLGGLNNRLRAFVATRSSMLEQVLN